MNVLKKIIFSPFARLQMLIAGKGLNGHVKDLIQNLPEDAKILWVGPAGHMGAQMRAEAEKRSLDLMTFDIDADKNPDIVGDIANPDLGENVYDVIFMIEILEHVKEFYKVPAHLHKALKPGGVLYLSTPFIFPLHDRPHDYYRFTRYALEDLFAEFSAVEVKERNSWAEAISVLLVRVFKEKRLSFRLLGMVLILYALVTYPLHWVLGKLFPSDFMTTGYVMRAVK